MSVTLATLMMVRNCVATEAWDVLNCLFHYPVYSALKYIFCSLLYGFSTDIS